MIERDERLFQTSSKQTTFLGRNHNKQKSRPVPERLRFVFGLLACFGGFDFFELLVEAVDAAVIGHDALVPGVEGMAIGAGIDLDFFADRRTGFEGRTARGAGHRAMMVVRMDALFHCLTPFAVRALAAQRAHKEYSD